MTKKTFSLISLLLTVALLFSSVGCGEKNKASNSSAETSSLPVFDSGDSSWAASGDTQTDPGAEIDGGKATVEYARPSLLQGLWLNADSDLSKAETLKEASSAAEKLIKKAHDLNVNTVVIDLTCGGNSVGLISRFPTDGEDDILDTIISSLRKYGMYVYLSAKLFSEDESVKISDGKAVYPSLDALSSAVKDHDVDGVILDGCGFTPSGEVYAQYAATSSGSGIEAYKQELVTACVREVESALRKLDGSLYIGVMADGADTSVNNNADTVKWLNRGVFNFGVICNFSSTDDKPSFSENDSAWREAITNADVKLYTLHNTENVTDSEELSKQLIYLNETENGGSIYYTASSFVNDKTGSTDKATDFISGVVSDSISSDYLKIKTPSKKTFTTYESSISISGSSNPNFPLKLNGEDVERSDLGYFSLKLKLNLGLNTFEFSHRGKTATLKVTYKLLIIKDVSPSKDITVDGASKLSVSVVALKNSDVTASIGSQLITLTASYGTDDDHNEGTVTDYCTYSGTFTIPAAQTTKVELGRVNVTASYKDQTATATGGVVSIAANGTEPDTDGSLEFGDLKLGKEGYIAEIARTQAETFDGDLNDNRSRPTNAYLPKGTLDYCTKSESVITSGSSTYKYRLLDYGKRVYSYTKVSGRSAKNDFMNLYYGKLPESNSISVAGYDNNGRHSYIVLNTLWKAPFDVTLAPQKYTDPYASTPNYTVSSLTYTYVEFKFAYCTAATGTVDLSNDPLFTSAEWIKNQDGTFSLRLNLKKVGGLYGWGASYNEKDQLVLSFLNPYKMNTAQNSYGYSLKGAVIMLDAGHGGADFGADGLAQSSSQYESAMNLVLANKVKDILDGLGATTIMTRTTNVEVTLDARNEMVWNYKPDIFISFHRNGSESASAKGYSIFYYEPYSMPLAKEIATRCTVLLPGNRAKLLNYSPPMQVCRVSDCPSVLTENWFMTNSTDFSHIISDSFNNQNAEETVKGIIAYFNSIQ